MRIRQTWMSALMAFAIVGCASRGTIETLEAELREKDDRILALENDLSKTRGDLEVARRESQTLRQQMTATGGSLLEEQSQVLSRVEKIRFHPLLTTGVNIDGHDGDDKLTVLLMPVDREGELLRLPGKIDLELFDMSLPPEQQRIGQWSFNPMQTRAHWQRSLLSAGYQFQLEWTKPPHARELTLHGRLSVADGRQFDATSQVKVELAQAGDTSEKKTPGAGIEPPEQSDELPAKPIPKTALPRSKKDSAIRRVSQKVSLDEKLDDADQSLKPPARRKTVTSDRFTEAEIPRFR